MRGTGQKLGGRAGTTRVDFREMKIQNHVRTETIGKRDGDGVQLTVER